ncbi:MAG: acetyltransferase [Methanospirillaceae archaeon]|nr:acetyltransferase [Methanospirillaceae archaeon]
MECKKQEIIIFGNGKMASLAYMYFLHDSIYNPVAFTVDNNYITESTFHNLPVVPFDNVTDSYSPDNYQMFIAIGYSKLNEIRTKKYSEAKSKGYHLVSYISSTCIAWNDLKIGENCFILENQVIQPNVKIGNNVFLWSGNHIGHDVNIGDNCYIASQVVISGNVDIGENTFIGINAAIRDHISIGSRCIIGAGVVITHKTKDEEVYVVENTKKYPLTSAQFERMMDISSKNS